MILGMRTNLKLEMFRDQLKNDYSVYFVVHKICDWAPVSEDAFVNFTNIALS